MDVKTGKSLCRIQGLGPVLSVAFSPDGKTALIGSDEVVLWSLTPEHQPLYLTGHPGPIESVAFSPEGGIVLTFFRNERMVRFWDAKTGEQLKELSVEGRGFKYISSGGCDLDNWNVLVGYEQGAAYIWNYKTEHKKWVTINTKYTSQIGNIGRASGGSINNVQLGFVGYIGGGAFNSTGEIIVTGSNMGQICLWDGSTGDQLKILITLDPLSISTVLFSPDSRTILIINNKRAQLFTRFRDSSCLSTTTRKNSAQKSYTEIYPLLFSPYK